MVQEERGCTLGFPLSWPARMHAQIKVWYELFGGTTCFLFFCMGFPLKFTPDPEDSHHHCPNNRDPMPKMKKNGMGFPPNSIPELEGSSIIMKGDPTCSLFYNIFTLSLYSAARQKSPVKS